MEIGVLQRLDRGQVDSTHLNDCEEEDGSGRYEDGSYTDGEDGSSSSDDWEVDEPVLKYRRFAKEVVGCLTQGKQPGPRSQEHHCLHGHSREGNSEVRVLGRCLLIRTTLLAVHRSGKVRRNYPSFGPRWKDHEGQRVRAGR